MKRSLLLTLALAPLAAQAGGESLPNPLALVNPLIKPLAPAGPFGSSLLTPSLLGSPYGGGIGNPFGGGYGNPLLGYGSPLGGFGNPLGGYASPLGGFGSPLGGYANPLGFGSPLGGYANPLTGFGSPLGGLGSPLGLTGLGLSGLGGASLLRPAIQVAPSLLSLQHQAPQMLTNPYMGGPFSQLPFAQTNRPGTFPGSPFGTGASGGFAAPSYPSLYGAPSQPAYASPYPGASSPMTGFPGAWGSVPRQPSAPVVQMAPPAANPYLPGGQPQPAPAQMQSPTPVPQVATIQPGFSSQQAASAQAIALGLVDLLKSLAVPPPAAPAGPAQTSVPFTSPWGSDTASLPAAPASPPAANPWGAVAMPSTPPAQPTAIEAAPALAPNPPMDEAPLTPLDPAYWLLPTPAEPAK